MRCTKVLPMRSHCVLFRSCGLVLLVLALCFCGAFTATGQEKPSQNQPAAAAKSPDVSKEGLVLEKTCVRYRMEADGTGTREETSRVRILADSGVKAMAVLTFTYTASNQLVEVGYVRVIKPDGTVVVTPDYNIQDMPADVTREAPMYSDIHQKHVAVKGLGVGDTLESKVTLRTLKPEVPGQFWLEYSFEKNLIALDEQLDLDLPADKSVTVTSDDLQPTVTTANGRKLYHWASSNLARPDPDAPPKSTKHWKPSVQATTFTSWEQVGAWYQSLQHDRLASTPAIQAKAAALTKGLTTDEDKIRAIFNDVALHTHYVGLDFGIGRYQPHEADDVLSNEYGDCKDKHTLLAAELKAAGIEAWPVLISSSRELDPAMPSPAQFDHVITLVPLGGKMMWMDSTAEVAPIGVLMAVLRDKQALAIPGSKPAYLVRTPADLPSPRVIQIQVEGKLSDQGLFTGHLAQTMDGDVGVLFRMGFRRVPQSQWKDLIENIAHSQGYAGDVSNPLVSEVEQISQPFNFSFDYTREKYYQWNDHDTSHWVSPPLPAMGGELAPGVKEKKPADEPELGSTGKTVYLAKMQLPAGWSMTPPENVDFKEDWFEYHAKYSFKDGTFTAERVALIKKTKLPLEDWEKYLALRRGMFEDWNRTVLISPSSQAVTEQMMRKIRSEAYKVLLPEEMQASVQPLRDAAAILQANPAASPADLAKALELGNKTVNEFEARSLTLPTADTHSLYWAWMLGLAWTERGWAALDSGDLPTAESYLRAAWHLDLDQLAGYQLGRLLEAKKDKAAAAHQYELAIIASENADKLLTFHDYDIQTHIRDSYQKLTGKPLNVTGLNRGQYNGSLRAELDKQTDFRGFIATSKVTGQALFTIACEAGKPAKASFLSGDKKLAPMAASLEGRRFGALLPASSKARLLREVNLVCSQYGGGCDAYLLSPDAIKIPAKSFGTITAPQGAPKEIKTVQLEVQP
jgi:tetratricopeptide (TPR) repeat protein